MTGCSGRLILTAVAAGYEVMERMAADFIPTVMARGFHASPVFGIFGAAIAAAKTKGVRAIPLSVSAPFHSQNSAKKAIRGHGFAARVAGLSRK